MTDVTPSGSSACIGRNANGSPYSARLSDWEEDLEEGRSSESSRRAHKRPTHLHTCLFLRWLTHHSDPSPGNDVAKVVGKQARKKLYYLSHCLPQASTIAAKVIRLVALHHDLASTSVLCPS